jgi:hypothetical protein
MFSEKTHCPPEHPEALCLQVTHKILLSLPFLNKNESVFLFEAPAEFTALASPSSILMEPISEAIVWDRSRRFSEKTCIG